MIDRRQGREFATDVVRLARTEQLTLLAAGVAFYGFISLVPLMLLAVGIAASIGGEALAEQLATAASDVLTQSAQELLAETVLDETGRQSATVVGAFGLLWGSSRVLRGLDRAFSKVYGTAASKSFIDTAWDAMIVFLVITFGLALVGVLEFVIRFVPFLGVTVVGPILVVLGLIVTFLPLYVVFPDANVGLREALPGTIIAAVGWFALSRTFSLYAQIATEQAVYGALGAVFLVLIWLYVGAIILVFGAVINAVLADREADRQLQSPGARQVPTEAMTDDDTGADEGATDDRVDAEPSAGTEPAGAASARRSARTRDRSDDPEALREEVERLRDRVDSFEDNVERRTVRKESLESDLKRYVRRRVRRGHATGWGPYLVLLYGTAMSIAAFYFLSGGWAILAMFVVWTSTLGVYALMVLFGFGLSILGLPGRLRNAIGDRRS
ncbi:YihY/virulence factor BrkB family protein [Natronolimnohabitans innermongolicus]|uniref:Ribonuclease BN n=1 Tax=Natronolimnohabitans innermongolicus JCM 12255 TaxID=1227499 RepID=L9WV09_9EURY|nr:YihY/virulence factor BrkB family protein [Natronolimnohabitans innermongolicus]ELY53295.1 ribonuclease BN [Natronolimnohabitans innermongolicus JCM 12255]